MSDKPEHRLGEGVQEPTPENAMQFEAPPPPVAIVETPGPTPHQRIRIR
jgi:hypothetical protein